jgi:hypothetical protein
VSEAQDREGSPAWDEGLAAYAPGKSVLIALTFVNATGEIQKRTQMHGVIESVDRQVGFLVSLRGAEQGKSVTLPPDARSFRLADLGRYELYGNGDIVIDPDLISAWTLTGQ